MNEEKSNLENNLTPDQEIPKKEETLEEILVKEGISTPSLETKSLEEEQQAPATPFSPGPIRETPPPPPRPIPPLTKEIPSREEKPFRPTVPPVPPFPEAPTKSELPREREFIPKKKAREFISREPETPKEIIRTFQKDLLRRQEEIKREEKVPEKEIIGFTPPEPPEEEAIKKPPKFQIPKIPIPQISLKFAIIILGLVLISTSLYLIFQFKPCLPFFCQKEEPTPTPTPIETPTETPTPTPIGPICPPFELLPPLSLLPPIPEERLIISEKSKTAILNALNSILKENYQLPATIRILLEYNPEECQKNWLQISELFEAFEIKTPANFLPAIQNYTLIYYLPDEEEKTACQKADDFSPTCFGPRLSLVLSLTNPELIKSEMLEWEKTLFSDFRPFILAEPKEEIIEFKEYNYKEKIPLKYKNLPISPIALNYAFHENLLIIGTSKNSLLKIVDLLLLQEPEKSLEENLTE